MILILKSLRFKKLDDPIALSQNLNTIGISVWI